MNKQAFWDIIEAGVNRFHDNDDESLNQRAAYIKGMLVSRPLNEIFLFQAIWNAYEAIAAKKEYAAQADDIAGELSGDGHDDYLAWFVIQGQANVEAMIKKPAEMHKIAHKGKYGGEVTCEAAGYIASQALEEKLGHYPEVEEDPYRNGEYDLEQDRFVSYDERHEKQYGTHWKHVIKILNAFDENKRLYQGHSKKRTKGQILAEALKEFESDILAEHARSLEP